MEPIKIYTDGACRNNQGENNIGAYGVVLLYNNNQKCLSGSFKNTTNNKMELTAVLEGLKALKRFDLPVIIYTDSQYVIGTLSQGWKRNANQDILQEIDMRLGYLTEGVTFMKVTGHSGDFYNELADRLCNEAMDKTV